MGSTATQLAAIHLMWQVCRCGFLVSYYHDISETTDWSRVWYCIELVWICIFRTKTNLNHQDIYDEGAKATKTDKMLYMKYISWTFFFGGGGVVFVWFLLFLFYFAYKNSHNIYLILDWIVPVQFMYEGCQIYT